MTPWRVGEKCWVRGVIVAIGIDGVNCEGQHLVAFKQDRFHKFFGGELLRTRPKRKRT